MATSRRRLRLTLAALGLLALLPGAAAHAQSSGVVAIRAGKILPLSGPAITNGVILIRNGKIVEVGKAVKIPAGAQIIDARTRVVMPGLVAAYSTLAIGADPEESISPDIRARDAFDYYGDYKRLLRGGLTTVYLSTSPRRLISGQGAVVKLAGETAAGRTLRSPADVRVALGALSKAPPALFRPAIPPTTDNPLLPAQHQFPSARPAELAVLRQFFADARRLAQGSLPHPTAVGASDAALHLGERDIKLRTVLPILGGHEPLRIHADTAIDIRQALAFGDEQHIKIVLEGATEGYRLAGEIARRHVPVVARTPLQPGRTVAADYARDLTNGRVNVENIAILMRAGVTVALAPSADSVRPFGGERAEERDDQRRRGPGRRGPRRQHRAGARCRPAHPERHAAGDPHSHRDDVGKRQNRLSAPRLLRHRRPPDRDTRRKDFHGDAGHHRKWRDPGSGW
jgi:imidazolonepropionase-like amidohydrolase